MAYRPKRVKRRPHHFRHRPRGFSGPVEGPIWRFVLSTFGIRREHRRGAYNVIALALMYALAFLLGAVGLLSEGLGGALGGMFVGCAAGWFILKSFRYFR